METKQTHRRCTFASTGNRGDILDERDHLSAYDGELGPWAYVAFDDGLRCWVQRSDLEVDQ